MPVSSQHRGWYWDAVNTELEVYVDSATKEVGITQNGGLEVVRGGLTVTAGGATVTAGGLTVTAGGATVTAGNLVATAGDIQATAGDLIAPAGNASLGNPGAFGTTQPTGAVVMGGSSLGGTAPVGAITTAGGVFASDTVVRKIIADGTASNVET